MNTFNFRPAASPGFTLVEIMVSCAIFSMVTVAMVYSHMFGLRLNQLVESKLGASDEARRGLGLLCRDVRTAKYHAIGNMSGTTFSPIPNGTLQIGNALQINLTINTNISIFYYFNTNTPGNYKLLRRRSSDINPTTIATHLTNNVGNSLLFMAENEQGVMQTDILNKRVVHFILDFRQFQYPLTQVGVGYLYDRYKMEFRLTPHVPEGL